MGAAAYARGSRVISAQFETERKGSGVDARADRQAHKDERARMLGRIAELETSLRRARRSITILRATLTEERIARAEERDQADRNHRFAVRVLARRAGLDNGATQRHTEEPKEGT